MPLHNTQAENFYEAYLQRVIWRSFHMTQSDITRFPKGRIQVDLTVNDGIVFA